MGVILLWCCYCVWPEAAGILGMGPEVSLQKPGDSLQLLCPGYGTQNPAGDRKQQPTRERNVMIARKCTSVQINKTNRRRDHDLNRSDVWQQDTRSRRCIFGPLSQIWSAVPSQIFMAHSCWGPEFYSPLPDWIIELVKLLNLLTDFVEGTRLWCARVEDRWHINRCVSCSFSDLHPWKRQVSSCRSQLITKEEEAATAPSAKFPGQIQGPHSETRAGETKTKHEAITKPKTTGIRLCRRHMYLHSILVISWFIWGSYIWYIENQACARSLPLCGAKEEHCCWDARWYKTNTITVHSPAARRTPFHILCQRWFRWRSHPWQPRLKARCGQSRSSRGRFPDLRPEPRWFPANTRARGQFSSESPWRNRIVQVAWPGPQAMLRPGRVNSCQSAPCTKMQTI